MGLARLGADPDYQTGSEWWKRILLLQINRLLLEIDSLQAFVCVCTEIVKGFYIISDKIEAKWPRHAHGYAGP